jgi:hypothetical protein
MAEVMRTRREDQYRQHVERLEADARKRQKAAGKRGKEGGRGKKKTPTQQIEQGNRNEQTTDAARAKAAKVDEVKDIRDKAEALRLYVKQQGQTLEMQNSCAEIKIRAERRAGEILAEQERHRPGDGRPPKALHAATHTVPTYKSLGIERTQAHRWQQVARMRSARFEQVIAETKDEKKLPPYAPYRPYRH